MNWNIGKYKAYQFITLGMGLGITKPKEEEATTFTTKCDNCGAVIYPEESEYIESKELEFGDGIVCDRCASKLRRQEKEEESKK